MQPEGRLCQKIVKHVEACFSDVLLEKVHGSPFGAVTLDLRGSVMGYAVEIEVKMPGKKPSARQEKRMRLLEEKKVITGWCCDVYDAEAIIRKGLQAKGVCHEARH